MRSKDRPNQKNGHSDVDQHVPCTGVYTTGTLCVKFHWYGTLVWGGHMAVGLGKYSMYGLFSST